MVLVDSSHENQAQQVPPEIANSPEFVRANSIMAIGLRIYQIGAPFGLLRAFKLMDASISLMFSETEKESVLAELYRTGRWNAIEREGDMTSAYSGQPQKLGDMPLVVLSQEMDAQKYFEQLSQVPETQLTLEMMQPMVDIYIENQDELAALSTRGKRIVVKDSGHNIQLDQPQAVIEAIREVYEQVSR